VCCGVIRSEKGRTNVKRSRHLVRAGLLLAVLGLAIAMSGAASGGSAKQNDKRIDPALVKRLKDNARGSVSISEKQSTEAAGFVRAGQNGDLLPADRAASPQGKAKGFLREYGSLLGATADGSDLVETSSFTDALGSTHVSYEQVYKGVPVFGATIRAHLDKDNNLTAVNGVAVPDIDLDVTPRLSAEQAAARAIAEVVSDPPTDAETGKAAQLSTADLHAARTTLYVYRTGLVRGAEGSNQLVYEVEVTNGANVRDVVFVHANAGKVVNRYSAVDDALFRRVFEQEFKPEKQVWQEGDLFPGTLNVDQQNIVNFSGQSYWLYANAFGRDSYDGAGAVMNTVNNDPRINCPNANWNGITTNYCNGVTADDVVAHEWTHAYTQYTSNLIYQWQPGALNESYSDIFGEIVDQINSAGSDSPAPVRTVGACATHTVPVPILIINTPTPGECPAGAAAFGPPLTPTGVTGDLVLGLDDVGTIPGDASPTNGCTPLTNAAAVAGKIALMDRGVCTFTTKVKNAQNAGAIAAVIANNNGGGVFGLGGGDATITIPSLGISNAHGDLLKGYLQAGGSNVTLKVKGGALPREDSFRWLLAEDATAFNPTAGVGNHAIRDMWDPTCLSDPGKVTDAEYQCDTSDGGGVHTNSGVPNHGFALLVDGGTYNGQTVTGIGLTKAAHIYFRAQSVYQTPTTDFADHADALEASCTDLIGQNLQGLSVTSIPAGPSGQSISAGDCAEVSDTIAAVQFRHDPTEQCNFKPLLDPNTPDLCANQKNPAVIYEEDFEDGLGGWTLTNQGVFAGWPGTNWVQKTSLPGGRSGAAAYAAGPDAGNCDHGDGDISGVMRLESPAIHLPAAGIQGPRLTFDHYVLTELNFDGGNLKISVNGGAYALVPKTAFVFNPYNTTLEPPTTGTPPVPRNTNPLAGQDAFSGTDGGQVFGSWGQSQIDLTKIGVNPGDTIRLRFDFGRDGCGGIDGWYVDDVKVRACNTKKAGRGSARSLAVTAWKQ
jgi:Zn-dependent metalloprotease